MPARRSSGNYGRNGCAPVHDLRSGGASPGAVCQRLFVSVNHLLTITPQHRLIEESPRALVRRRKIDRSSWGRAEARGAPRSNVMSSPDVRYQANLLSEFVLAIFGALGLGVPIAVAIIWICS
jgi:hypothetical protein